MATGVLVAADFTRIPPFRTLDRRPVITGLGVVSPTGIGKAPFWDAITEGHSAIRTISRFDATSYPCRIAAEIPDDIYNQFAPLQRRRIATRSTLYALLAVELALTDAALSVDVYDPSTRAVSFGTSLGGFHDAYEQVGVLLEKGASRVNPFIALGSANHVAALEIAATWFAQGPHLTVSTGCTSSLQAIAYGADLIASGASDLCIAGGTEAPINPLVVAAMCRSRELSTANNHPTASSRPFDRGHDGLVLSEGSAVVILETLENAMARGAFIYAEILSHAAGVDGTAPFRGSANSQPALALLQHCLNRSHLTLRDIDYICANGNSLPLLDLKEISVLQSAQHRTRSSIPVSSIKGVTGHSLGAAAAFQVVTSCLALQHNLIPPNWNLSDPDSAAGIELVVDRALERQLQRVLVCSYGFGGMNAFMALGSVDPIRSL